MIFLVEITTLALLGVCKDKETIGLIWLSMLLSYNSPVRNAGNRSILVNLYFFKKPEIGDSAIWISFSIVYCYKSL